MRYLPVVAFIVLSFVVNFVACKNPVELDCVLLTKQMSILRMENAARTLVVNEKDTLEGSDFVSKAKISIEADSVEYVYGPTKVDFSLSTIRLLNDWTLNFETKEKKTGAKMKIKIEKPKTTKVLPALSLPHNISRTRDFAKGIDTMTFVFDKEDVGVVLTVPYFPPWNHKLIAFQELVDVFTLERPAFKNSYSFYFDGIYFYFENVSKTSVRLLCFHESVPLAEFAPQKTGYPMATSSLPSRFHFISTAGTGHSQKFQVPSEMAARFGLPSSVKLSARNALQTSGLSVQQVLIALAASLVVCVASAMF